MCSMCIRENFLFHNDISPYFKFLFSIESLDLKKYLNIKRINKKYTHY